MKTEDCLTFAQTAAALGVTRTRVYQLIEEGKIVPAATIGGRRFFSRPAVQKLLKARRKAKSRVGAA